MKGEIIANPMVSVCVITYNQEAYIQQCLESILQQETNFEYDVVVGEDCSTDNTASIIKSLSEFGQNIQLLKNTSNLGVLPNFIRTLKACKGKYIAFCEGDDYWIDEHKLQKQVDFLEQNPEYGGVCGEIINLNVEENLNIKNALKTPGPITFEDTIFKNKIHSNTILFRRGIIDIDDLQSIKNLSIGDWYLHLLVTKNMPYYYMPEYFALYREHNQGIFSKKTAFYKSYQKSRMLAVFLKSTSEDVYRKLIKKSLYHQLSIAFRASSQTDKKELLDLFKLTYKSGIIKINRSYIQGVVKLLK